MTTVSQRPVQQRLSDWMTQQGVQPSTASRAQLEKAAKDINAPMGEVMHARSALVEQSGAHLEAAGQKSQAMRDAAQGARADQGGRALGQSPAMARFNAATPKEMTEAFAKSGYTAEDAHATMAKFGLPTLGAAREFIGAKVLGGQEGVLADKGITRSKYDAHEQMAGFRKSTYSDSDAEAAIKKLPFLGNATVQEAREYIGLKVLNGAEDILAKVGITQSRYDDHEQMDAFKKSQYTNDDAMAARKAFSFLKDDTLDGVKQYMGLKILNNYESMLSDVGITQSKYDDHEQMGAFSRSGYSEADALAAKKAFSFLKNSSLDEVKQYLGLKILNKYESMLSDVGITQDKYDSHDQMAAFRKSTYSETDAVAAKKAFSFLKDSSLDEVKQYMGLKILNNYESMLSDVGITQSKYDAHEQMAAFNQSGYTDADAQKALKAFSFLKGSPLKEVKEYLGLKVLNNNEQMLRDVGIQRQR